MQLLDLGIPRVILKYDGKKILVKVFVEIKKYDNALLYYDAINMVTWMADASKFRKVVISSSSLAKMQPKKILYY